MEKNYQTKNSFNMSSVAKGKAFRVLLAFCLAFIILANNGITSKAGDFTDATTIALDGKWTDKYPITSDNDVYYKFSVSNAGSLTIKLMGYARSEYVDLYDGDFNRIGNDSAWGSDSSPETTTYTKTISQGTYYIKVSQGWEDSGSYRLNVSFDSYGISATFNDSFDSPRSLSVDSKVTGAFTYNNDEEWFKVVLPAGKYKQICTNSTGSTIAILYDSDLNYIDGFGGSSSGASSEEELTAGTYYVNITGSDCKFTYQINTILPKKGEILEDSKGQYSYKVTKAGKKNGTVSFYRVTNSSKTSVTVPDTVKLDGITYKVTGICADAFASYAIKKVTIGKNVSSISSYAFRNCTNLKTLVIKSTSLKSSTLKAKAFKGISTKVTIKVPSSKLKTYKSLFVKKGLNKKVKVKKY
jgi:hypothetical protein